MVSQLPESLIRSVIAALIAFACFQSSRAQKSDPPRFERYSADVYAGHKFMKQTLNQALALR